MTQPPQATQPPVGGVPSPAGTPPQGQNVREMASERYREALLRRVGGGGQAQPTAGPPAGAPPQTDPAAALQGLMKTRNSRRVLRAGSQ